MRKRACVSSRGNAGQFWQIENTATTPFTLEELDLHASGSGQLDFAHSPPRPHKVPSRGNMGPPQHPQRDLSTSACQEHRTSEEAQCPFRTRVCLLATPNPKHSTRVSQPIVLVLHHAQVRPSRQVTSSFQQRPQELEVFHGEWVGSHLVFFRTLPPPRQPQSDKLNR